MRHRRGFTLLEVMVSLAILVAAMAILIESQGSAALMTQEAEKILIATELAHEKMAEVQFLVENEGFQADDVYEDGDFDDFGDEALDLELKGLEEFHYEYLVTQIDLSQAGDIAGTMQNVMGDYSASHDGDATTQGNAATAASATSALGGLPIGPEMIGTMLDPFIREVKVRVWWGEDTDEAEEMGNEVIITTHMINPHGNMLAGLPFLNGGAGGQNGANGGQNGQGGNRGLNGRQGINGQNNGINGQNNGFNGLPGARPGGAGGFPGRGGGFGKPGGF